MVSVDFQGSGVGCMSLGKRMVGYGQWVAVVGLPICPARVVDWQHQSRWGVWQSVHALWACEFCR